MEQLNSIVVEAEIQLSQARAVRKAIRTGGDYTAADVQAAFANLRNHEGAYKDEIMKQLNASSEHKRKRADTKANIVDQAYENALRDLVYANGDSFMVQISYGEDRVNARYASIERHINAMTDESITAHRAKKQARRDAEKKIMDNPETLSELRTKKARTELSADEQARLDELEALNSKERKAADREKVADAATKNLGGFTVTETKHTKTDETLYVVKLSERLDSAAFKAIQAQMRKIGGHWSSFTKGFNFKTDPTEMLTITELKGNSELSDDQSEEQTVPTNKTAERLRTLADNMQKSIDGKYADRLTNTYRRANQAAYAAKEGDYLTRIQSIMRNIADAIEAGEVTHLDGITAKTHIELLNSLLSRRVREMMHANKEQTLDRSGNHIFRDPRPEDINGMEYPKPLLSADNLKSLIDRLISGKISGTMRTAAKLDKLVSDAKKKGDHLVDVTRYFDETLEILKIAKNSKYKVIAEEAESLEDRLTQAKRLLAMGIETPEQLRSALREFLKFREGTGVSAEQLKQREIKSKGDEAARSNIAGFFPTPKIIVTRMIDEAQIEEGMKVLEPSAGKGDIAQSIQDSGVKVDVIEINHTLQTLLEAKGFNRVGEDFLAFTEAGYDRIIMNPPFEKGQDIDHVRHAFDLLASGGRVVAIMSEGPFYRSDKKACDFREWVEELDGVSEKLPDGAFKSADRPTGVNTRLLIIDKPAYTQAISKGMPEPYSWEGTNGLEQMVINL
jgi:hypothetical protein